MKKVYCVFQAVYIPSIEVGIEEEIFPTGNSELKVLVYVDEFESEEKAVEIASEIFDFDFYIIPKYIQK